jgi:hypothetical protein
MKEADMRITSGISAAALLTLLLVGLSSGAQEAISPATAAGNDDATVTASSQASTPASGHSKIRIVRLSEVKGEVQLDRQTGKGFESAMANLPVIEGETLKTGNGVAEVEFEDNSTVRVAQDSQIAFPRLELLPSGAKASSVNVIKGTIYVSLVNTKGNEFTVTAGQGKINLPPDTHVRLQLTQDQASLAVLHGEAMVEEPAGSTTVDKNRTLTFNLAGQSQPVIAKNVEQEPLDSWDKDATQYHKSFASASSYGNAPYSYGINDLNYYGSFSSGCGGSLWRPYFTSASWDPYSSGAWAYYPSAGYSWVSPYPWGWTPYHYGSWSFCQGIGWGWRPGGNWMGLANNSFGSSPITRPRPPIHPPSKAESTLVPVNLKAIPSSGLGTHDTFVFRKDSAGMGVPRASLGKLNSFSGQTVQHGAASTNVYWGGSAPRGAAESGSRSSFSAPVSSMSSAPTSSYSGNMQGPSAAGGSHASAGAGGGAGGGSARH